MKKLAGAVNCRYLLSLLLSILFAFLIGAGILAVSGFHPLEAYGAMLSGAFDSARHIGDFLEYAMVLCVCGLACVLGARVGIFNVGGEGQLLLGAIFMATDYSTSPCRSACGWMGSPASLSSSARRSPRWRSAACTLSSPAF